MMKKIKTNIQGFDELVEGGFPQGSSILLSGSAGTGKTIFSLQYLYNGAVKEKEKGVYFSFEEKKESLFEQAKQFGWDLEKLEKSGMLKIISIGTDSIDKNTVKEMIEIVQSSKTKRVVVDSITTLSHLVPQSTENIINKYSIKRFLYQFLTLFNEAGDITTIFISQKDERTSDMIAEYLCDGVINIDYESMGGDYSRSLIIRKMRKTKNDEEVHPMEISPKGVVIHKIR